MQTKQELGRTVHTLEPGDILEVRDEYEGGRTFQLIVNADGSLRVQGRGQVTMRPTAANVIHLESE